MIYPPLSWCCAWLREWPAYSQVLPTLTWWMSWRIEGFRGEASKKESNERNRDHILCCIQAPCPPPLCWGDPFCSKGNHLTQHIELRGGEKLYSGNCSVIWLVVQRWATWSFLPQMTIRGKRCTDELWVWLMWEGWVGLVGWMEVLCRVRGNMRSYHRSRGLCGVGFSCASCHCKTLGCRWTILFVQNVIYFLPFESTIK